MARPLQKGLNYFPMDVTFDQDDKIALIESDFGIDGFSIIVKLLMKVYSEGYFYHWGEKEQKLFARRINIDLLTVVDVINAALRWNLFNQTLFDNYGILTSRGIQKRYFEAVSRRKDVQVAEEYILLTKQELSKYTNLVIFSLTQNTKIENSNVDEDISVPQEELMSTLTTQSKVEENKVNQK